MKTTLWSVLRIRIPDPVPFWPLDPERFFLDPGTQTYFWDIIDNFLAKKFYNSLLIGLNFFLHQLKYKKF